MMEDALDQKTATLIHLQKASMGAAGPNANVGRTGTDDPSAIPSPSRSCMYTNFIIS
jgi:hypothetical protein